MLNGIGCEHTSDNLSTAVFLFYPSDNVALALCEDCYSRLKAAVLQDMLGDMAKEFAREITRLNFSKR